MRSYFIFTIFCYLLYVYLLLSASLCNWDLFRDADHLCGLLRCLDGHQWKAICERLVKNHRHTRSGFPDLTLWNPETGSCCFVEVKSPNDRLSTKQILWLEYLNKHGIESLVCHVEALNAKKIAATSASSSRPTSSNNTSSDSQSSTQYRNKLKASPKKSSAKKGMHVAPMSGEPVGAAKNHNNLSVSAVDNSGNSSSKKKLPSSGGKAKRSRKSSGDDFER